MDEILDKFTQHSRKALQKAVELAFETGHRQVRQEHLLYGLLLEKGSISSELLNKIKLEPSELKHWITKNSPKNQPIAQTSVRAKETRAEKIGFSSSLKDLIKKTVLLSYLYEHQYVGTEHLLAVLIQSADATLKKIFSDFKIHAKDLEQQLLMVLKSTSKFPDLTDTFQSLREQNLEESSNRALDYFSVDLTHRNYQKKIEPVFCRDQEITRLIQILLRKTKNNPILLGEPGVGKTAIVEGLAKRIYERQVPDLLLDKRIVALDLSAVVAGSMYRGDFENRLKQIIEDVTQDPDVILFIDEIHTIIGAGAAMGSLDAANILKPALARGEIRCIGAATHDDYRKNIEKDQALARRFQPIIVKETSPDQTIEILKGAKAGYEKYHRIKISESALAEAVKLADRYITDRFFPDKALDLIDEASAQARLKRGLNPRQNKLRETKNRLEKIIKAKRQAILDEQFARAIELKKEEDQLLNQLDELKKKTLEVKISEKDEINAKDIRRVISQITNIPVSELMAEEREKLRQLESLMNAKIIGQAEAIRAVTNCIKRSRLGLNNTNHPIGSFIFLGPSGSGKTATAKALAEVVFEDPKALIRLDMSEYGEKFNISKLIGAPAGYVGHDEAGVLTEAVKRRPYSVVLFDEFEKAHPEIFNLLLQILDEGFIMDASGKEVNFRNTIVILTSNLGAENLIDKEKVGFNRTSVAGTDLAAKPAPNWEWVKSQMEKALKDTVRPELLNRFDKVILFEPLKPNCIEEIFEIKLKDLENRLKNRGVLFKVSGSARQLLVNHEANAAIGARIIERNIANLIETQLADLILEKDLNNAVINVLVKNRKIVLEIV